MPRRNRRTILGKRAQLERLRHEEELKELERELHHAWQERQADTATDTQADDTTADDNSAADD